MTPPRAQGSWSVRSYSEFRKVFEGKGELPGQVRTFLDGWIPKLEVDPFTAGGFEQWGKTGPGIFSAHLPREWRALFTVDQEKRLVFLHTLQDHENYDTDRVRRRIRDRMRRGNHSGSLLLPTEAALVQADAQTEPAPIAEALTPQERWIASVDLEELGIAQRHWEAILSIPTSNGEPKFQEGRLPKEVTDLLEAWYTSGETHLDKLYEVRMVAGKDPSSAPLVTMRLSLDPSQKEAEQRLLQAKGPYMVKGGPGTGKSIVLLHAAVERASQESQRTIPDEDRKPTGLLTFNKPIRDRHLADAADLAQGLGIASWAENINASTYLVISNIDRWVTAPILKEVLGYTKKALRDEQELRWMRKAMEELQAQQPEQGRVLEQLKQRGGEDYLLSEINSVILGWGFTEKESYLRADRKGRKLALRPQEREAMWTLACLHGKRMRDAKEWTFTSARPKVLKALQDHPDLVRRFAFELLFVDEAQDLHPVMLQLLLTLVGGDPKRLRLASDPGQCLFGQALVWNRVDERLTFQGRTTLLRESHRSGKAMAEAIHGLRVSKDDGLEPIPIPTAERRGETPRLVLRPSSEQIQWMADWWQEWIRLGRSPKDVGILCRDLDTKRMVQRGLGLDQADTEGPVRLLRQIRGPEWPVIIIPFLSQSRFPPPTDHQGLQGDALREAMEEERSLLYVGLTRASHRAILLADPDDRSELLDHLDLTKWTIDEAGA
jgi:AAA domain